MENSRAEGPVKMTKFQSVDIGKTASAASIIFESLRKTIIEGDLNEGEPLRQDEIARSFNTSRIPVREALTMLEQQGLVKIERYRGAVVAGLSVEEANEIFEFRAMLEAEIIRKAVPNLTRDVLDEARHYLERFHQSTDAMEFGDLNRAFHGALYSVSHKPFHLSVMENAMDRIDRYLRAQLILSDGMERAHKEHLAILEACEKGDGETAAALTAAHILGAKTSLAEQIDKQKKG
jgi:DNA-binding GntR family transcriptional regulator